MRARSGGVGGGRDEAGHSTLMLVALAMMFMVAGGLVIDGGYALSARRDAMHVAEQAARAGSDALNEGALRSGNVRVDPGRAAAVARGYLSRSGMSGSVSVAGGAVTVTARTRQETVILGIVGIGSFPIAATATAESIDEDDSGGGAD